MDKLGLTIDLIRTLATHATSDELIDSIQNAFDIVDTIEREAIKRRLYFPDTCPTCGEKILMQELNSLTDKTFRVSCGCIDLRGHNKNEMIDRWTNR